MNEDGTKEHIVDNWRASGDPCRRTDKYFKGKTVFKLSSKPNGSRLEGKQSTLPVVEPKKKDTFTSRQTITFLAPAVKTLQPQHFATEIVQRNFRRMLVEFGGDKDDEKSALEAHKKAVVQQLQIQPLVNLMIPYVRDIWIELPTFWIRMHDVQRDRQFSQKDQELPGLGEKRFAMIVDSETQEILVVTTDNWRLSGDILLRPNSKKDLGIQEIQPEGELDFAAQKSQYLRVPPKMKCLSTI